MVEHDVFLSYAREDAEQVRLVQDALEAAGVGVWVDEADVAEFASISGAIEQGLATARCLLAYYSSTYPTKRPCQWELTTAFIAAQRAGDPRRRVLVINPEADARHISPVQLRDALFVTPPRNADMAALAESVALHVRGLEGALGDAAGPIQPPWYGERGVGSARFVGRLTEMWAINTALHAGEVGLVTGARGAGVGQVRGLGGIGKSLLAQEYALRFGAAYPGGVFWLRAYGHDDARAALSADARDAERDRQLSAFAVQLGVEVAGRSPGEVESALARAMRERALPCLWIVDDLPSDLERDELNAWLAPDGSARTLLTTRSRGYGSIGMSIDLGVLDEEDAARLLSLHRKPEGADEERAAVGLARDLGWHAQAVDVAGAALRAEAGLRTFAEFRESLTSSTTDELDLAAMLSDALPNGHERSIATTLARSVDRLSGPGRDFLRLASLLAAEPISARLVASVFAKVDDLGSTDALRRTVEGMRQADALSLSELVDEQDGARLIHTLVSRTVRFREHDLTRVDALRQAAVTALREDLAAPGAAAHARRLASAPEGAAQESLLGAVAALDAERGDYRSAAAALREVSDAARRRLGDEHPAVMNLASGLAAMLAEAGDPRSALGTAQAVLAARQRTLGEDHPDTLGSVDTLAVIQYHLGDFAAARALHEHAIEASSRVLGAEHPDTLVALEHLAGVLRAQGELHGACDLYERVLEARRRLLGTEHRQTFSTLNNLASTLAALGDMTRPLGLFEEALGISTRVQGAEHPDTLVAQYHVATRLLKPEEQPRARELMEQALAGSRRMLGDDHPQTLMILTALGLRLSEAGDAGSIAALEEVLARTRQSMGDRHPMSLSALSYVASAHCRHGVLWTAYQLYLQAYEGRLGVLGAEHPDTLQTMSDLGVVLVLAGKLDHALACQEGALAGRIQVLGPDHPDSLASLNEVAAIYGNLGDLPRARTLLEQALEASRRVLGEDDPKTLATLCNLAYAVEEMGDRAGAIELYEQVFAGRRRVLGDDHPDTVGASHAVADLRAHRRGR